jgi:HAMP domain-containing protein
MYNKNEQLLSAEKAQIREFLRAHINRHRTIYYGMHLFYSFRMATVGFTSIALIIGSISYAAEYALPGDVLYTVKVEINERVRSLTAVTSTQQAEWSVTRMTRRLEELEQLVVEGALDKKTREEVATRFEHDTKEAHAVIAQLKIQSIQAAADTSSRLEESLRIHERVLTQVAEEREDVSMQIHVMLDTVREKAQSVSEIRQEIEKERDEAQDILKNNGEKQIATSSDSVLNSSITTKTDFSTTTP